MLWDTIQNLQIRDARFSASRADKKASRAADKAEDLAMDVEDLGKRVDSLTLLSMALWELFKQETNLTDELIKKKIEEIDMLDGKLDGKLNPPHPDCPSCKRRNNARRTHCLYCGDELPRRSPLG